MLYAKVVLGLPVEGPFDYIVPENFAQKIKVGVRVWVSFHNRKLLGYLVRLTHKTKIKNLKSISEVVDEFPILDKNMLLLTKELSEYYCCSWGETIDTALPEDLRRGRCIDTQGQPPFRGNPCVTKAKDKPDITLVHDLDGKARWNIYLKEMREILAKNKSTLILLPDINSVLKAKETIKDEIGISPVLLYRKQPQELAEWVRIKEGKTNIVVGTRSGIFAPLNNLGLVIIDQEEDTVYKQEQMPHYNARGVAFMRINIEKVKLLLGSASPSLETFYLAKKNKIRYVFLTKESNFPEIKVIDTKTILSKYLIDSIALNLNTQAKILLFLNRKGFATSASCRYCARVLRCPRCNINLVYHFKSDVLSCHYCNFKMTAPKICPNCNSAYIRYSGMGTEKIESELARLFPQARIRRLETLKELDLKDIDILISAKQIIKETNYNFDLIAILAIDNSLNRIDLRSAEKTFGLLIGLLKLTQKTLLIQTALPNHHCFRALENKNIDIFYAEELRQRKQLNFPPYQHLALVKLRGRNETRVKELSNDLFERLKKYKSKTTKIISVSHGQPLKLRGNFYWQILIRADRAQKLSRFLKMHLKNFAHSGIIVTVDIDPL